MLVTDRRIGRMKSTLREGRRFSERLPSQEHSSVRDAHFIMGKSNILARTRPHPRNMLLKLGAYPRCVPFTRTSRHPPRQLRHAPHPRCGRVGRQNLPAADGRGIRGDASNSPREQAYRPRAHLHTAVRKHSARRADCLAPCWYRFPVERSERLTTGWCYLLRLCVARAVGRTPGFGGISPPHAHGIVWDVASGKVLRTVRHDDAVQVQSIALRRIENGSRPAGRKRERAWDVGSGKRMLALPNENPDHKHPDPEVKEPGASQVLCLAFSPNGRLEIGVQNGPTSGS
jgi:hypothetical protein